MRIDWQGDLQDQIVRDYINAEKFAELCSRNGIATDTTVVFYGDKSNWWACYAFWAFKLFGHENCKVMNGGRKLWIDQGRPMSTEVPRYPATKYKVAGGQRGRRSAPSATRSWLTSKAGKPLIDVRSPKEFTGELLHMEDYPQEGALRGGHIPGAKNVPWSRAVNEDGTFKSAEELRTHLPGGARAQARRRRRRLLPDRRAVEPDLVCPDLPARVLQGPELRRVVDRMGQPGPRADRQGSLSDSLHRGSDALLPPLSGLAAATNLAREFSAGLGRWEGPELRTGHRVELS